MTTLRCTVALSRLRFRFGPTATLGKTASEATEEQEEGSHALVGFHDGADGGKQEEMRDGWRLVVRSVVGAARLNGDSAARHGEAATATTVADWPKCEPRRGVQCLTLCCVKEGQIKTRDQAVRSRMPFNAGSSEHSAHEAPSRLTQEGVKALEGGSVRDHREIRE